MATKVSSVEEYIELAPEDSQDALRQMRSMVLDKIPNVLETVQYNMPTYQVSGEIVFAFASQKNYFSFYICHYDLIEAQEAITRNYDCGKSCIRFKYFNSQVKKDLIKIMVYAFNNREGSIYYGKYLAK